MIMRECWCIQKVPCTRSLALVEGHKNLETGGSRTALTAEQENSGQGKARSMKWQLKKKTKLTHAQTSQEQSGIASGEVRTGSHKLCYLRLVNVVEHDHPLAVPGDMQLLVHLPHTRAPGLKRAQYSNSLVGAQGGQGMGTEKRPLVTLARRGTKNG